MEQKTNDMAQELSESLEHIMDENMAERRKQLYRHKMPTDHSLRALLLAMTKSELDDIRYNLHVTGASSLKKAELAECLVPAILAFAKRWLPTIVDEEYGCFSHLLQKGGLSTELRDDDTRLDYLRGLGLVACGVQDDKMAFCMPDEVQELFKSLDSGAYRSLVELNTELSRLSAGLLYYYGYLNFEQLYEKVLTYLEPEQREEVSFMDFVGVVLNVSCWKDTIVALPHGVKYYTLIDEEKLENEQLRRSNLDFASLSYGDVYDAGADNYIADTPAYKELAQFFMREHGCDVLKAADITGEILILLQNGSELDEAVDYLEELGFLKDERKAEAVVPLLIAFNNTTHLWPLKGHTPAELMEQAGGGRVIPFAEVRKLKVGRNDPCPCGSGKKYKNCCLRKDEQ
ncbi:SEC-C metal-binding domain-containing protein [Mitsuokella sp.]|uniref:SEC-C metal-binding domain-containing protein n=1 Tax=Mitsuokella TaxID=52225 RepID=UPI0029E23E9E|nr:SEC-C metal-binding domain-containing protein [Mitsuokella sp.]MDD6383512.1 SEC-C metal-binding domain-containing protein [Selenomonadaceae bacterium]MDY4475008.1 SEC-C metal-binding domain-containing protein [Mitsuokella sp.]